MDALQRELDEATALNRAAIENKDHQIGQLQALLEMRAPKVTQTKCQTCVMLEQKLEDLGQTSQAEIHTLRTRILELEQAASRMDSTKSPLKAQADSELDKLKKTVAAQQNELKEYRRKLEEAERKSRALPDVEKRYKTVVDQLRNEQLTMRHDLKTKTSTARALNDRVGQNQKQIHELQAQLQKARDDLARLVARREEPPMIVGRDPASVIQSLQLQVSEKNRECESYEKLLAQTQNQLSPLMEITIPRLKAQIGNLRRERDEVINQIQKVAQLGVYVEQVVGHEAGSSELVMFFTALHQLQNEYARMAHATGS
jgi:chromosome segregation ATPase